MTIPKTVTELRKMMPGFQVKLNQVHSEINLYHNENPMGYGEDYLLAIFKWPWYGEGLRSERRAIIAAIYAAGKAFSGARS